MESDRSLNSTGWPKRLNRASNEMSEMAETEFEVGSLRDCLPVFNCRC